MHFKNCDDLQETVHKKKLRDTKASFSRLLFSVFFWYFLTETLLIMKKTKLLSMNIPKLTNLFVLKKDPTVDVSKQISRKIIC